MVEAEKLPSAAVWQANSDEKPKSPKTPVNKGKTDSFHCPFFLGITKEQDARTCSVIFFVSCRGIIDCRTVL